MGFGAVCRCGCALDVDLMLRESFRVKTRTCVKGTKQATPRVAVRVSATAWVSELFVDAAMSWMWP